jgi:hypothetical protein
MKPLVTLARELAEAREKATPGPWYRVGTGASGVMSEEMRGGLHVGVCSAWKFPNLYSEGTMPDQEQQIANAELIPLAVNAIPALIECVAELDKVLNHYEAGHKVCGWHESECCASEMLAELRRVLGERT